MRRGLVAVVVVLLAGCGGPTTGTVVDKRHEEERRWQEWVTDYVWVNTPVWNGKTYMYTSRWQPVGGHYETRVDDEDWVLVLDNEGERGEVEVDEWTWRETQPGTWWGEQP